MNRFVRASLLATVAIWVGAAVAEQTTSPCGPLHTQHYGPYDYRTQRARLEIVEAGHFTPEVEALVRGHTGDLGKDLDYTLLAAPNHHRALVALIRWGGMLKTTQPPGLEYSIECFLERGLRFAPDDTVVRTLYAQYVGKLGRRDEAISQLDATLKYAGDNAYSQFNVGLIFFELGAYDRALEQAHKAKALGLDRPELEDMLKRAGKWQEPTP